MCNIVKERDKIKLGLKNGPPKCIIYFFIFNYYYYYDMTKEGWTDIRFEAIMVYLNLEM